MIGWWPVLLPVLAVAIAGLAGVHSWRDTRTSPPCKSAHALLGDGLLREARTAYVELLKQDETDPCVTKGLDDVTNAACVRAATLAAADRRDGIKAYQAIATAEPVRGAAQCALTALSRLAAPASTKLTASQASAR